MGEFEKNKNNLNETELLKAERSEDTQNNKIDNKQENYRFMKEVIIEIPVNIRKLLLKGAGLLAGAVAFGLVSAFVFVHFLPIFQEKSEKTSKIVFEEDEPLDVAAPTPAPAEEQQTAETASLPAAENVEDMTLDTYQEIYDQMNAIAKETMHCVVTVTGISSSEDWFNITTESIRQASGVIVAESNREYYILTEYRTVDKVDRIMITFPDGSLADGRYQMHDPNTGLTILKVDMDDLTSDCIANVMIATLGNSYEIQQGEAVIAIGSPMGYSNSIVHGQVTSTTSTVSAYDVQYNLLITNILGSSNGSGILADLDGNVIGIIAQKFSDENSKNVITGLPISQLKSLISVLSNNGQIPYLGIKGQNVTTEISKQTGMPKGIYVNELDLDSPALQAGIQKADIIIEYDGKSVETMYQYSENLSKGSPGDVVDVTVMRKGAEGYVEFEFQVTLGNR